MFNFGGKDKDGQRFRNLVMFNFYGTDEEWEDVAPIIGVVALVVIVLVIGYCVLKHFHVL